MRLPKLLYSMPDFYCPECNTKMKKAKNKDKHYRYCPKCKKDILMFTLDEEKTKELRKLFS